MRRLRRFRAATTRGSSGASESGFCWQRSGSASSPSAHASLLTVVGVAGVGKSRLTAEFLSSLGDATVVRGRCLPYGEGITYRPVIEVVEQLPRVELDPPAAAALRSLLGSEATSASADEIGWAFRKLLGAAAAECPLVVVFEDIQWAEERFLELVEQLALLSGDAPILLLCLARPELLDASPRWPVALRLEPLRRRRPSG